MTTISTYTHSISLYLFLSHTHSDFSLHKLVSLLWSILFIVSISVFVSIGNRLWHRHRQRDWDGSTVRFDTQLLCGTSEEQWNTHRKWSSIPFNVLDVFEIVRIYFPWTRRVRYHHQLYVCLPFDVGASVMWGGTGKETDSIEMEKREMERIVYPVERVQHITCVAIFVVVICSMEMICFSFVVGDLITILVGNR